MGFRNAPTAHRLRTSPSGPRIEISADNGQQINMFTGDPDEKIPGELYSKLSTGTSTPLDRGSVFLRPPVVGTSMALPGIVISGAGPTRDNSDPGGWVISGDVALTYSTPASASSAAPRGYVDSRLRRSITSGTTDANGDIAVTHGLGTTPAAVTVDLVGTGAGQQFGKLVLTGTPTSTTFTVRLYDTRNGAALTGFAIQVAWAAYA
jgi:hypothetical protein